MITPEEIQKRLDAITAEMVVLKDKHEQTVQQLQMVISNNQNRFAQLKGAHAELTQLLKGIDYEPSNPNGSDSDTQPDAPVDRVSGARHNTGDNLGTTVVHRKLDTPDPASG